MRKEFCEKDGIYISYTNDDVCFEDITTAESILLKNNGEIIHSNFDEEKNQFFQKHLFKEGQYIDFENQTKLYFRLLK